MASSEVLSKSVKERIKESQISMLFIPSTKYRAAVDELLKFLVQGTGSSKICHVSLRVPVSMMVSTLKRGELDLSKFYIVDAVSSVMEIRETVRDVGHAYVSHPGALTELGIWIGEAYREHKFDALVFDSFSALMMYASDSEILRFILNLVARMRSYGSRGVFPLLWGDKDSTVAKDLCTFVDTVIELGE